MKSPLSKKSEVATLAGPGRVASFIRFVIFGGGVGVLCSFAVPLLAMAMPWVASNAIITVVSTLLCTELHARFTFGKGRGAGWREHWQSAGSATAAYLATSLAVWILHLVQSSPGMISEYIVYLGASGLAGTGRFLVLRLYVFAARPDRPARPLTRLGTVAAPVVVAAQEVVQMYSTAASSSQSARFSTPRCENRIGESSFSASPSHSLRACS
ncbi:GtrA family protein [Streptomyces sp. NPDC046862]|uniref:GtrA family protein n=1 Tax=Streptomyces sp. NPDC046862 TaxID=3154603 RepID=UPI0034557B6C